MTRVEAAAYLGVKGWKGKPTTLAKYATEGTGPPFTKAADGRTTVDTKADLDAWMAARGNKLHPNRGGRPRKVTNDLLNELNDFLPMVERVASGQGTFQDGVQFVQGLERMKRAVRQRRNGSH